MLVHLVMVVFVVDKVSTSASWNLTTLTVSFGKDIMLWCSIGEKNESNVSKQQADLRHWTGGQKYDLLCMNGQCLNPSKYEMLTRNTSQDFGLLIHNLSESDLNCQYTCSCGFSDFTKNLSVEPKYVISLPAIEKTTKNRKNINNGKMEIEIMLDKVNPVPHCSALFKGRFINETTVAVMKWYTYHNDVKVIFNFPVDDVGCDGRLQILCTLVYRNVTIFDEYIDMCQEKEASMLTMILLVIGCAAFAIILSICICFTKRRDAQFGVRCWSNVKKKRIERKNINQVQLMTFSDKHQHEKETSAMIEV
ncbi:uncharacterized protein LOC127710945 [Mytilus californianus]|uniref:uncharacterized protein LOC127710945 n=1 Tax=Mytilus californianus TaxID=6549 RepID=UPI0022482AFD|nr:uncharacterized protein LOC127710945 [Mytilus californianus]XP_052072863.1 uncharacterized protein LOC127710945 [Mytilus californianus]